MSASAAARVHVLLTGQSMMARNAISSASQIPQCRRRQAETSPDP